MRTCAGIRLASEGDFVICRIEGWESNRRVIHPKRITLMGAKKAETEIFASTKIRPVSLEPTTFGVSSRRCANSATSGVEFCHRKGVFETTRVVGHARAGDTRPLLLRRPKLPTQKIEKSSRRELFCQQCNFCENDAFQGGFGILFFRIMEISSKHPNCAVFSLLSRPRRRGVLHG